MYSLAPHSYLPNLEIFLKSSNFWPILTHPPSVTLCHTSRDPPQVRHTSRAPQFLVGLVQKIPDKSPLYKFYLTCSRRFLSGLVFVLSPLYHNTSVATES